MRRSENPSWRMFREVTKSAPPSSGGWVNADEAPPAPNANVLICAGWADAATGATNTIATAVTIAKRALICSSPVVAFQREPTRGRARWLETAHDLESGSGGMLRA